MFQFDSFEERLGGFGFKWFTFLLERKNLMALNFILLIVYK